MHSLLKYLLLSFLVSGCAGPETIIISKYLIENHFVSMIEVVVPTDDTTYPDKILYIGRTTQRATLSALRSPDNNVGSSSGYSYWDYCYSQGNKIALKISRQKQECNALRLYFDNRDVLYDYSMGMSAKLHMLASQKKSSVRLLTSL